MISDFNDSLRARIFKWTGISLADSDVGCISSLCEIDASHLSVAAKILEDSGPVVACYYFRCLFSEGLARWVKPIVNDVLVEGQDFNKWLESVEKAG